MKITKKRLQKIINEEIKKIISENPAGFGISPILTGVADNPQSEITEVFEAAASMNGSMFDQEAVGMLDEHGSYGKGFSVKDAWIQGKDMVDHIIWKSKDPSGDVHNDLQLYIPLLPEEIRTLATQETEKMKTLTNAHLPLVQLRAEALLHVINGLMRQVYVDRGPLKGAGACERAVAGKGWEGCGTAKYPLQSEAFEIGETYRVEEHTGHNAMAIIDIDFTQEARNLKWSFSLLKERLQKIGGVLRDARLHEKIYNGRMPGVKSFDHHDEESGVHNLYKSEKPNTTPDKDQKSKEEEAGQRRGANPTESRNKKKLQEIIEEEVALILEEVMPKEEIKRLIDGNVNSNPWFEWEVYAKEAYAELDPELYPDPKYRQRMQSLHAAAKRIRMFLDDEKIKIESEDQLKFSKIISQAREQQQLQRAGDGYAGEKKQMLILELDKLIAKYLPYAQGTGAPAGG